MTTVSTSPVPSTDPATWPDQFAADMAAVEAEIHVRRQAEQIEDDQRCGRCGDPTEGVSILGCHIQICPCCLELFVESEGWTKAAPEPLPIRIPKFIKLYA